VQDINRDKLHWSNVIEKLRIIIPAQSTKELDVCAMLYLDPIEFSRINQTLFDANRLVNLANGLQIPAIISPSESGIQGPPSLNRYVETGTYRIEVNYKGTHRLPISIVINSQMDELDAFITVRT
jgi:hypothetical protein